MKLKFLAVCLSLTLLTSYAWGQARQIQSSDITTALGYTPVSPSGTFTTGDLIVGIAPTATKDALNFGTNGGISLSGGGTPAFNNCFWNDTNSCTTENIRARERLFVGNAALMGDNQTNCCASTFLSNSTVGAAFIPRDAQLLAMSDNGTIGIAGITQNSNTPAGHAAIGVSGYAMNNTASFGTAWAGYFEAQHNPTTDAGSQTYGIEVDCKNATSSNDTAGPYGLGSGCYGVWIAGGGGIYGPTVTNPANAAVAILANQSTWNVGIVFQDGSLTKDGSNNSVALSMGQGAQLEWFISAGVNGAAIRSTVSSSGQNLTLNFANNQFQFLRSGGGVLAFMTHVSSGVNGFNFNDAISGNAPFIQPTGSDAIIGMDVRTKSTGVIRIYPGADVAGAFQVLNAGLTKTYLSVDTSANTVSLPQVTTGTPAASLCVDTNNIIIKKTTTGPCV